MTRRASALFLAGSTACLLLFAQLPSSAQFAGAKAGDERTVEGVKLCWCPPGRFRMGSPPEEPERRPDEGPVEVTLTRGFWMGKYEVTQGEWKRIVGTPFPRPMDKGQGDDFPAYWVSFLDAEGFCRKLTDRAHNSGQLPGTWEFRLPTEAQWEYAARAGTTTAWSFGDRLSGEQANFDARTPSGEGLYRRQATGVGAFPANAWGIHDMHGNVWEWCRDWYHYALPGGADPDLSATKGAPNRDGTYSKVRRSGAWIESAADSRSARRLRYEPERNSDHIGFRILAIQK